MPKSPIGSIIAYGGPRPTRAWEEQEGWLHCDGRLLDRDEVVNGTQAYRALWQTIWYAWGGDGDAKFNLPNLQGFFLRGVDASHQAPRPDAQVPSPVDPDRDQRIPSAVGGNAGANVGSVQLFATAMPRTPFTNYPGGEHDHRMSFETSASRDVGDELNTVAHPSLYADRNDWPNTTVDGRHAHKIEGGDKETRPVNAYVYWIIRYR
jgi:hypothetical protein